MDKEDMNNQEDMMGSNNPEVNELAQNTDDVLKDVENLLNKSEMKEKFDLGKENEKEVKKNENPSVKINISTDENTTEEAEIPLKNLSNPIDFVNYIEYELPKQNIKIKKDTFILKKYENEQNIKFIVSELNPQEELSLLMLRGDADITAAVAYEDNIITGDIFGDIKFYSLKDKKLARTISCPLKKPTQINAIDLSDDGDYAFVGFNNGNVALYELTSNKCKLINNKAHTTACINVKFIQRIDKKTFKIFSSDEEGNVLSIIFKSGLFGFSTDKVEKFFEKSKYPTFLIYPLNFKEDEIKNQNFLKKIKKSVVLGNLQNINLYSLEPKKDKIFTFEKPNYINNTSIPDIAVGLGKHPSSNDSLFDEDEIHLLLIISWDKVVYLFIIPVLNRELTYPLLSGYYVNDNQIIRIGFLNISTIYIIDIRGNFKVLNSRKFNLGDLQIEKDLLNPIIPSDNNKAELQNVIKFDGSILKQLILKTPTGSIKETFLYSIMNNLTKDELNVLTNKKLYNQQLLDYQKYLKDLQKKENWMELLILGMNIYKGKMTSLNGIPPNAEERKKVIGEYLQGLISQFLFTNAGSQQALNNNKNNYFDPSYENARIEKNMEITIEFCIEIESVDYLLDKILKIYESKKYKDIFLKKLVPFILCNKMIKFNIPEEIILDLIKLYESKVETLSNLLLHININSLDVPSVKEKLENLFLINPLIYLYVNGKSPDYFKPILSIYNKFISAQEVPNFVSYENLLKSNQVSLKELQATKQYLGHQLIWYIKKSLTGKKYPDYNKDMDKELYLKTMSKITYWLLNAEVLNNLIFFENKTFFDIFTYIFSNEEIISYLEENNYNDEAKKEALELLNNNSFKNINPNDLVLYLINEGNKYGNQNYLIFLYLCIFIVNVSKEMNLDKNNKKEAIKFIVENYSKFNNVEIDLKKIINNIKNILDDLEFNADDFREILSIMNHHKFDEVKLYILKKTKNYKECLDLFLDEQSELKDKRKTIFTFINMTLTNLRQKGGDKNQIFQDFRKFVMDNLIRLGKLSIDDLQSLIDTWYSKEKDEVLNALSGDPEVLLNYVEILVRKIVNALKENEGIIEDKEEDKTKAILKLHLKLLVMFHKKDRILSSLQECSLYPLDEFFELCTTMPEYIGEFDEALIYAFKRAGNIEKALCLSLTFITFKYNQILENLYQKFNENLYDIRVIEFNKAYNDTVNLIEENEQALSKDHEMWFSLLNMFYLLDDTFPTQRQFIPKENEKHTEEVSKLIKDKLIHLLEKMSTYVGVKTILDIVCEKNQNSEFREFKPLFLKMLASFGSQTHILHSVTDFITHTCLQKQYVLQQFYTKGKELDLDYCDVCLKKFSQTMKDREELLIFKCNHQEHQYCSFKGEENKEEIKICPICLRQEMEHSIVLFNQAKDPSYYKELIKNNSNINASNNVQINDINIFSYKKGFNRMKKFDKYAIDKKNVFYYDSAKTCRDKYRKKYFGD